MGQTSLFPPIVNTAKIGQDVVDKEVRWRVGGMYKPMQGVLIEPGRTNKCTCVKANPVDTTSMAVDSGRPEDLTVVDMSEALLRSGLSHLCVSGMVYRLDNSTNATNRYARCMGSTGNTNPHTMSAYICGTGKGGVRKSGLSGVGSVENIALTDSFVRVSDMGNAAATVSEGVIIANPYSVVYFILPQLEEGSFCTSPIWRSSNYTEPNTPITRAAVCCSAPIADYMRPNNVAFMGEVNLNGLTQTDHGQLVGTTVDADNYFRINFRTIYNAVYIEKRIGGVSYSAPGCFYGTGLNTTIFQYQGFLCSTNGVGLRIRWYIDGAWSVWTDWQINTNTQDVPLGSTFEIGHQAGGYQLSAYHRWHRTWFHNNSKAFLEGLTT